MLMPQLDDHGKLIPFTPDQCMSVLTEWVSTYPGARFVVAAVAPDGTDARELGWGLALPDHVFVHLPEVGVDGRFSTAENVVRLLRRVMDARLIWVDPEPGLCPDEPARD